MSLMAEALQPYIVRGLFEVPGKLPAIRLAEIIIDKNSAYSLLLEENCNNTLLLDFRDGNYVSKVVAADSNRLSIAALQSVFEAKRLCADKFATPWVVVKLYYSAFYAAHSIVRILGGGCCWLENIHISRVRELAQLIGLGYSFKVEPGNYRCALEKSGTTIRWKKITSAKGTHESFWSYFENFLKDVSEKILIGRLPARDAQEIFSKINSFLELGAKRKSSCWMSKIRNDIQYQFEYNVWHANSFRQKERESLSNLIDLWELEPLDIDLNAGNRFGDLGDLIVASAFLNSLCIDIFKRIASRGSHGKKSFANLGPLHFVNFRKKIS